jgi:hypothetical protein
MALASVALFSSGIDRHETDENEKRRERNYFKQMVEDVVDAAAAAFLILNDASTRYLYPCLI